MRRLIFCTVSTIMLMLAAPAGACIPPNIQFESGSIRIDPDNQWAIDDTVSDYRARRGVRVRLTAQTGIGRAERSMQLARRRAQAVKAALVRRGIPAGRIDLAFERGSGQPAVWLDVVAAAADRGGGCSG